MRDSIRDKMHERGERHQLSRVLNAAMEVAAHYELPYGVVVCLPQHLQDEPVDDVVKTAASRVRDFVRESDLAGQLTAEVIAVGLPEATPEGARALAYRLQSELGLRTAYLGSMTWQAGYACLPKDTSEPFDLLAAATQSARESRLRD